MVSQLPVEGIRLARVDFHFHCYPWPERTNGLVWGKLTRETECLLVYECLWSMNYRFYSKIILLRVIPTMTFIHFLTGNSSGILSDISSGILSGISSGICSGISSGILSGISYAILSGKTFWHSIWHIFWHSIWHTFWHSIWHIFWHSIWHIFWHSIWHIFWHMFLTYLLAYLYAIFIWHIFWHSIWHSVWHIFWHSIWPLRSSGAHWAGKVPGWGPAVHTERGQVPGWGPAVHTELGRSQVEVQRCTLSWAGPRLRSSGAHWAGQVPGWGPLVHTGLGSWQKAWRRESAKRVGKEPGEELARRKCRWKLMQTWSRRNWRRRRGGGRGGRGQLVEEEEEAEEERSDKI